MKMLVIAIMCSWGVVATAGQIGVLDEIDWSGLQVQPSNDDAAADVSSFSNSIESVQMEASIPGEMSSSDWFGEQNATVARKEEEAVSNVNFNSKNLNYIKNAIATASKADLVRLRKLVKDIIATEQLTETEKPIFQNIRHIFDEAID